jgi:hypothetical protein
MIKSFKEKRQTSTGGAAMKPFRQFPGIRSGELFVLLIFGQFNNCLRAHTAIEVIVEQNFRQSSDKFFFEFHKLSFCLNVVIFIIPVFQFFFLPRTECFHPKLISTLFEYHRTVPGLVEDV